MDQWLDSLSEDWVSQPRSPHSSSGLQGSILRDSPIPSINCSQSRIPRFKPRTASSLSTASVKDREISSSVQKSGKSEGALKEKTSSNINASHKPNEQGKPGHGTSRSPRLGGRHASTGSTSNFVQDTVQHKSSPVKERELHGTPEWKRRVLKENAGGDLFGPTSLESVFKPPTVKVKPKAKPPGKRKLFAKREPLSTPPQPPTLSNVSIDGPTHDPNEPAVTLSPRVESLDENKIKQDLKKEVTRERSPVNSPKDGGIEVDNQISKTPTCAPDPSQAEASNLSLPCSQAQWPVDSDSALGSRSMEYSKLFSDKPRDENISPFYVTRQNTVDGRIEYAAIDMSMRRLRSQMDRMRVQQQNIPSSRSSDHERDFTEFRPSASSAFEEQLHDLTSQSLPNDLSMGTDAFAANGGFVSVRRGGYSNDGSFQRRPVSPSLLPDFKGPSVDLPSPTDNNKASPHPEQFQNFSQSKSKTPSSQPPSSAPQTPRRQKHESSGSNDRPRSSGSPLKLFDKYDTFTNERLVRRMSKFEETLQQVPQEGSKYESFNELPSSPSPRRRRSIKPGNTDTSDKIVISHRVSSFGDGELDEHQFPPHEARKSLEPNGDFEVRNNGFRFLQPTINVDIETSSCPRDSKTKERDIRPWVGEDTNKNSRNYISPEKTLDGEKEDQKDNKQHNPQSYTITTTGKRLPYSPAKDPAPKRRRTLVISETSERAHTSVQETLTAQEGPRTSILGRKRKDARYDDDRQAADPETLAMRPMRQLRLPTSGHDRHSTRLSKPGVNPSVAVTRPELPHDSLQTRQENHPAIDPPTQIVAGALATVALNTAQEVAYGSRKASVTTADFFNEAQQIMQLIRAKGRPRSSHATTEGSGLGQPTIVEESIAESTKDEFSRPPSRDGSPLGLKEPAKPNARVLSHLRKFEEDDQNLGLALSSSMKTLKMNQTRRQSQSSLSSREEDHSLNSGTESDPPNTRIRKSMMQIHKRKHSSSTFDGSIIGSHQQDGTQNTQSTSGPSSSRSNPTGSSHSSTNRMIIAPETVAHLLSDQMAGMVFDRQKQLWVKRKSSPIVDQGNQHDHTVSEGTEEDFFGDIPDLSVDEMEELQRVKDAVSSVKSMGSATEKISIHDQALFSETRTNPSQKCDQTGSYRPKTAENKSITAVDNSSAPSKFSHFASSGPQAGTRATSWNDNTFPTKEYQVPLRSPHASPTDNFNDKEEQVEHEISIFEGRESRTPKHEMNKKHQARVVTVAFSSPLVEQRESYSACESEINKGESELDRDETPVRSDSHQAVPTKRPMSSGSGRKSGRRNTPRRMSICNQPHIPRPMSRLDEEEEMSLVQCSISNRHMSLDVALTTPLSISKSLMMPPTSGGRSSVGFHLSPLPEFTVHQIDKAIDGHHGHLTRRLPGSAADNRLSLAAQELVKNLTDLEPYEPYWDYIRNIDLHERDLSTLHMLDDFCGRVEELDVSNNRIRELNGIPSSVRQLNVRNNCLSDLAAWDFLRNLQYLDVSNNQISNLQGFQHLYHIRSLRLDGNDITTLDGLEDLNGLTSLSLRDNRIRVADFENFDLQRLTKLDLCNNELAQLLNLHRLPVLETCILGNNELETLDFAISVPLLKLENLDISENRLSFIDLAKVPNLRSLNLDRNSIASIESLDGLKRLETISWREQTLIPAFGFSEIQYQHCLEVRNLYLSGNNITAFAPSTPFLNLHKLELASTGLQSLSSDFGLMCPNLRALNLNYNAIRDLRPLLGVVRLQRLFLVGNRVSRLRRTAGVLHNIGNELSDVDLRNNPLTVGFYTPQDLSRERKQMIPHNPKSSIPVEGVETRCANVFLLPPLDKEADNLSRERLDEDTKLRRRVYEMLQVNACKKLERLDGVDVDRKNVGAKDRIWERLVELGILKEKAKSTTTMFTE